MLASLPDMTHRRLRALVERGGGPVGALAGLERGLASAVLCEGVSSNDLAGAAVAGAGVAGRGAQRSGARVRSLARRARVFVAGRAGYPLDEELPDRPEVLLAEGDVPEALDRPRVAVVGHARQPPRTGSTTHVSSGRRLARAGVTVVSGLAIGIDGAVHEGALDAGGTVIGVVATGLDVVYPRRHRTLFDRVRASGLIMSELAYGTEPRQHAFPVRNRIIAGLAQVTVVVEATLKGGARITADCAGDYGRTVLAYPGSRRNPASAGTNQLLYDGATDRPRPVRRVAGARDVGHGRASGSALTAAGRPGRGAGGVPRRTGHPRPTGEPHPDVSLAGGRRGPRPRARRMDGAVARPVLAAMRRLSRLLPGATPQ